MTRETCRTTGIYVDQCMHCPMPGESVSTLPEPAVATRRRLTTEPAGRVLSDKLRARLIGRGRGEWFGSCGKWTRCAVCKHAMAEGDPVRFLYGRTARDMATLGWCCEHLDSDTIKAVLRRGGYESTMGPGGGSGDEPTGDTPRRGMFAT